MYIHEIDNWTDFRWDASEVSLFQEKVFRKQGLLYGRLSSSGFDSKLRAMAENLTYDVVCSSEIEGIRLNVEQVRSSIARKLGLENVKYTAPSHYVDSVVGVMLEAVQHYDMPLSKEKLCAWQAAFFPTGYNEGGQIEIGQYRTNEEHIVSGMFGREKIHYIAPSPDSVEEEMEKFIEELATENISYTAEKTGNVYDFNTAEKLNQLLIKLLLATGQLAEGGEYDVDFDHQFLEAEKYDCKRTYKGFDGYSPGVFTIGGLIAYLENRDGNANVDVRYLSLDSSNVIDRTKETRRRRTLYYH